MRGRLGYPTVMTVNNVLTRAKNLRLAIGDPDDIE